MGAPRKKQIGRPVNGTGKSFNETLRRFHPLLQRRQIGFAYR